MEPDEIKETARKEKDRDIKPIEIDFYDQAETAVRSVEEDMRKLRPRSLEYRMLEDQLSSMTSDIESIFMRRVGKVIDRATSVAFSSPGAVFMKKDYDKLLPQEQILFQTVYRAIMDARRELVAAVIEDGSDTGILADIGNITDEKRKSRRASAGSASGAGSAPGPGSSADTGKSGTADDVSPDPGDPAKPGQDPAETMQDTNIMNMGLGSLNSLPKKPKKHETGTGKFPPGDMFSPHYSGSSPADPSGSGPSSSDPSGSGPSSADPSGSDPSAPDSYGQE